MKLNLFVPNMINCPKCGQEAYLNSNGYIEQATHRGFKYQCCRCHRSSYFTELHRLESYLPWDVDYKRFEIEHTHQFAQRNSKLIGGIGEVVDYEWAQRIVELGNLDTEGISMPGEVWQEFEEAYETMEEKLGASL